MVTERCRRGRPSRGAEDPAFCARYCGSLVRTNLHGFCARGTPHRTRIPGSGQNHRGGWDRRQPPRTTKVVLMAGLHWGVGLSLVLPCSITVNNGQSETQANMLGPFLAGRSADQPPKRRYAWCAHRTPGPGLVVHACIEDVNGRPIAGAEIDVWHSSPEGPL